MEWGVFPEYLNAPTLGFSALDGVWSFSRVWLIYPHPDGTLPFDQGDDFVSQWRSAWFFVGLGLAFPDPTEQVAVPAQDSVRLDDDQSLLPRAQLAGQKDDEGAIAPGELWTQGLALEHAQLLTEEGVFED